MARPTAPALRRRLRRLDKPALARFVAALWAGAGWSTAVRGTRVVASRRTPRPERRIIANVAGPRALADALVRPPDDADLLVAPAGGAVARLLEVRTGRRVLDADDLHERLTYGIDDAAREHVLSALDTGPPRPPTRRAVLSALAVGAGGMAAGATAPAPAPAPPTELNRDVAPQIRHELEGSPTTGRVVAGFDGANVSQQSPCDAGPRAAVHQQVTVLHRELRTRRESDADLSRVLDDGNPALSEGFVEALEAVGVEPLRRATAVYTGAAEHDGHRARVRVRGPTGGGKRVVYVFALTRADDGCWQITGAWNYSGEKSG